MLLTNGKNQAAENKNTTSNHETWESLIKSDIHALWWLLKRRGCLILLLASLWIWLPWTSHSKSFTWDPYWEKCWLASAMSKTDKGFAEGKTDKSFAELVWLKVRLKNCIDLESWKVEKKDVVKFLDDLWNDVSEIKKDFELYEEAFINHERSRSEFDKIKVKIDNLYPFLKKNAFIFYHVVNQIDDPIKDLIMDRRFEREQFNMKAKFYIEFLPESILFLKLYFSWAVKLSKYSTWYNKFNTDSPEFCRKFSNAGKDNCDAEKNKQYYNTLKRKFDDMIVPLIKLIYFAKEWLGYKW